MNKDKKGDVGFTFREIGIFLLAILGFLIVLFFFVIFKGSVNTYDEACQLSVLARATTDAKLSKSAAGYIPLKCNTKKICLRNNGKCDDSFAGEKEVEYVSLPSAEDEAVLKIEEVSANAMYDCWRMMGAGKYDLFNGGFARYLGLEADKVSCVVCSRLAFNARSEVLNKTDIGDYLKKNKIPNSDTTYLQYFTDRTFQTFPDINWDEVYDVSKEMKMNEYGFDSTSTRQYAVVFSQVEAKGYGETFTNLGKTGIIASMGAMLIAPKTTAKVASTVVRGGLPSVILVGVGAAGLSIYSMSNVHAGKVAAASYCGQIAGASGSTLERCSGIQIVPYEAASINNICAVIEGNP